MVEDIEVAGEGIKMMEMVVNDRIIIEAEEEEDTLIGTTTMMENNAPSIEEEEEDIEVEAEQIITKHRTILKLLERREKSK